MAQQSFSNTRVYLCSPKNVYESKQITVNTGVTKANIKSLHPTLWSSIKTANFLSIYSTETITIYLNANTNDPIEIKADAERIFSPVDLGLQITNVFISNSSGSNSTIDILIS